VPGWWLEGWAVAVVAVVGIELLVHGAAHGAMATAFPIMSPSSRWFVSVPNAVSAVLYAVAMAVCLVLPPWLGGSLGGLAGTAAWWGGGLMMALVCGCARERGASVWAAVTLHLLIVIGWWTVLSVAG
jgi:hypothetical protein